jgi:hypothetical protein
MIVDGEAFEVPRNRGAESDDGTSLAASRLVEVGLQVDGVSPGRAGPSAITLR